MDRSNHQAEKGGTVTNKPKVAEYITNYYAVKYDKYLYIVELKSQIGLIPPPEIEFYYGPPKDRYVKFVYCGSSQADIARAYGTTQQSISRAIKRGNELPFYKLHSNK